MSSERDPPSVLLARDGDLPARYEIPKRLGPGLDG